MKRIASSLSALLLTILLLIPFTASAASASASLSGPGTVRAGDTITLTFKLSGSGLSGASGTLSYDGSQLQLTGTKQKIAAPWAVEWSGNNMVAYDNNLSAPINGGKDLFTVSFKVKDVAAGTKITVSYQDVKASDGSADAGIGTVRYSATVGAPLSGDNALTSLTVSNATISPAFHANTTSYTAEVPFSVSKLEVEATAADGKAKVSVNSPTLKPDGTTNVTVTVTAENGAKKTYTIRVHREKDPNYVASGNNTLAGITVDGFLLSPGFRADVTEYVVWLPYETASVKISGKAADGRASVAVIGGDNLAAGQDNPVQVICHGGKRRQEGVHGRCQAGGGPRRPCGREADHAGDRTDPGGHDDGRSCSGKCRTSLRRPLVDAAAGGGGWPGRRHRHGIWAVCEEKRPLTNRQAWLPPKAPGHTAGGFWGVGHRGPESGPL